MKSCLERNLELVFIWEYTKTNKSIIRPALDQSNCREAGQALILIERHIIICNISIMVKQPENGSKDYTVLEIAGKRIIQSGYCMLLKSIYCFIFQFFFNVIPHMLYAMSKYVQSIQLYINSSHFIQACLRYKMTTLSCSILVCL